MAEKKTKIDLKQRLAKGQPAPGPNGSLSSTNPGLPNVTATSAGVPSAPPSSSNDVRPPPAVTAGIPAPVLPPTSGAPSGGLPAPPFGGGGAFAKPEVANPFAKNEPKKPPRPQDIKLEVTAEAVEAAKAMRKFIGVAGVGGAVAGMLIGMVVGSGYSSSRREASAIEGASMLAQDVEAANAKIDLLSAKIGEAVKEMEARKFPENFVKDLGGISVPFDGSKLVGRGVGNYDRRTLNLLFQYVADVQALNSRKEALQNLFGGQKQAIKSALEQGEKPQLNYTILVTKSQKGPVASIAPLTTPFAFNSDWPKSLSMSNLVTREKQDIARYESGDVYSTAEKRVGIPVESQSVAAAFPNDISSRVLSELFKTRQLLIGSPGGEDESSAGVVKNGKELAKSLREMGKK